MTTPTAQEVAGRAAEAVRALNHLTRPGVAETDVSDVYDLLDELALMASRLPQLLGQLEDLIDQLVEADQVRIVDGPNTGDSVAVAVIAGHWLTVATSAADELATCIDQARQSLTWASSTRP